MNNQQAVPHKLALFASGTGSNVQKIIDYFKHNSNVSIALIVCNKAGAGVLGIAATEGIPALLIEKEKFFRGDGYVPELCAAGINFIVLAGFLWKVPTTLIEAFPRKIINIHPALLPRFGGKGMYGHYVHQAVLDAGEPQTGITIHYVDGQYDNGDIIFQATCPVLSGDDITAIQKKVQQLEHTHYPQVIENILKTVC